MGVEYVINGESRETSVCRRVNLFLKIEGWKKAKDTTYIK